MTNHPNRNAFRTAARKFVQDFVKTGRQWGDWTIEGYMPEGWELRPGAVYMGKCTVEEITQFMRAEAVPAQR